MGAYSVIRRALYHKTKNNYYYRNKEGEKVWEAVYEKGEGDETISLYHYGTLLIKVSLVSEKILDYYKGRWSMSDRNGLEALNCALERIERFRFRDYGFFHGKMLIGKELEKRIKFIENIRSKLYEKVKRYPDAIPYIQKLGFTIEYVESNRWEEFCEKNGFREWSYYYDTYVLFVRPNTLAIKYSATEDNSKIALTHCIKKLNGVVTLKTVYFKFYEEDKKFSVKDVRLIGKDETNQLWSLRLPVSYYLANIEKSEQWVMGIDENYEIVEQQ
jgi:hypothetical protein